MTNRRRSFPVFFGHSGFGLPSSFGFRHSSFPAPRPFDIRCFAPLQCPRIVKFLWRSPVAKKTAPNTFADAPVLNPAQLGGIETSVLDNGPGRGVRIAWVNTGGGLRYKVVIDRGLDIADAEFMGQSLTWHSYGGVVAPQHAYNRALEWLRGFY